jgi:hypothetical protein
MASPCKLPNKGTPHCSPCGVRGGTPWWWLVDKGASSNAEGVQGLRTLCCSQPSATTHHALPRNAPRSPTRAEPCVTRPLLRAPYPCCPSRRLLRRAAGKRRGRGRRAAPQDTATMQSLQPLMDGARPSMSRHVREQVKAREVPPPPHTHTRTSTRDPGGGSGAGCAAEVLPAACVRRDPARGSLETAAVVGPWLVTPCCRMRPARPRDGVPLPANPQLLPTGHAHARQTHVVFSTATSAHEVGNRTAHCPRSVAASVAAWGDGVGL